MPEAKKALVVDDEEDCREFVRAVLEPEGFEVITAENGRECLEKVKSDRPDLVVMDVMMPEMHGYDACDELKSDESTRSIPVILLTGVTKRLHDTTFSHQQGMETEADDYIAKPVDPEDLLQAVRKLT